MRNRDVRGLKAGLLMIVLTLLAASGACAGDAGAPPTEAGTVSDTYWGVTVADPYRWLELSTDPEVHNWSVAQDKRTRQYLDALPIRALLHERLTKLTAGASPNYSRLYPIGDKVFALYNQPPKQQPMIIVLDNDTDPSRSHIIVDPNTINPKGTTAIDWFVPSPDGTKLAVSLSANGSEDGTLHIFDAAAGSETGETIPRVQYPTGGGGLAWTEDGLSFYYTRYPGPSRPAEEQHFFLQIWHHRLGTDPASDTYVAGTDFPKVAEIKLHSRQNKHVIVAEVANGDGGEFAYYLIGTDGKITQVSHFHDRIVAAVAGPDDNLYLVSRKDAPRGKLLSLPLSDPDLAKAHVIVPEGEAVMQSGGESIVVTDRSLYVREIVGGPSRVARFSHDGTDEGKLLLPDPSSVAEIAALSNGHLLYSIATYLRPPYFARLDEATGLSDETKLAQTSPVEFANAEVVRVFSTSKDGTQVPFDLVRRKGTRLDGSNPVLLNGYGGYGVSQVPFFLDARIRLWLDGGGMFVIANLRGGGEYGETWHTNGALTHKQNVFDDFYAVATYLIAQRYTTPERLAILGGSNGGLLMGASFTQHPELYRAVVSQVGIYDMLRVELDPNGAFNTTEFGSTKDLEQFKALYAYSPYHHVIDGAKYPATFMATGENDGRVNPMQSRKMIARLQAATGSGRPIYLSTNSDAGHGIGSSLAILIDQRADYLAFLFDQLGMTMP
jgi:prolyl oligopeptidase